jgi:Zn-finger nucleic acid-binding protein
MQTYNRNGVQIEQCGNCRGIFLDYGELEALTRIEAQYSAQPAPPPQAYPAPAPQPYPQQHAPSWGAPQHGGHGGGHYGHHKHRSLGHMLFSS